MGNKFYPLKGYEGFYEINIKGTIRTWYNKNGIKYKTPRISNVGYLSIRLTKNGTHKTKHIHRLLCETFIPNINNKPQVNHKDGNKLNNSIDNLEWVSRSENMVHAYSIGLVDLSKRKKQEKNGICSKKVNKISLDGVLIKTYESMSEAEREGYWTSGICKCCKGKQKSHKGYFWKYN